MANKKFKFVLFHLFFIGIITYYYMKGVTFSGKKISSIVDEYFGIGRYIILSIIFSNFLSVFMEKKKEKNYITLLSHMLYPLFIAVFCILITYELNLFKVIVKDSLQYQFLQLAIFKYNIGLISTYILSKTIMSAEPKFFWGMLALSIFFITMAVVLLLKFTIFNQINKIKRERKEKLRIEEEERRVLESIAIKEAIEKKELEQTKNINEEEEQDRKKMVKEMTPYIFEYLSKSSIEEESELEKKVDNSGETVGEGNFKLFEIEEESEVELQLIPLDLFEEYEKRMEESRGEQQ